MYATEEETETNVAYQALKSRVCYVVQTIVFSVAVSDIATKLQDLEVNNFLKDLSLGCWFGHFSHN